MLVLRIMTTFRTRAAPAALREKTVFTRAEVEAVQ
jgi:hypothetical protein